MYTIKHCVGRKDEQTRMFHKYDVKEPKATTRSCCQRTIESFIKRYFCLLIIKEELICHKSQLTVEGQIHLSSHVWMELNQMHSWSRNAKCF